MIIRMNWRYQFEQSLGLAILDLCPPGHLSQQALLVDIIFEDIGHLSRNFAPHFSDQRDNNDENLCQISDQ